MATLAPPLELESTEPVIVSVTKRDKHRIESLTHTKGPAAIQAAVVAFLKLSGEVTLSRDVLADIAARSGVQRIQSSEELLDAFERMSHLDRLSIVVSLDPSATSQAQALADSYKMPLSAAVKSMFENFIAAGGLDYRTEQKSVLMTHEHFALLPELLGVERVNGGMDLIAGIKAMRMRIQELEAAQVEEEIGTEVDGEKPGHIQAKDAKPGKVASRKSTVSVP